MKQSLQRFFHQKSILITGASGFVGSHLSARLKSLGATVFGLSDSEIRDSIKVNILNYEAVHKIIAAKKINICFHLAGVSLVEAGQEDPYKTFKTNVEGAINVLENARKTKLEKVIIASTVHVYGNNKLPFLEEYTPRPTRPYETSKACIDLISQSYATSFHLPVLIPRFVNIYGPGDLHFERLIPKTIKSVLSGNSPVMWGGSAVRDYLYIDDAIDAYIRLAGVDMEKVGDNRIFNFGSGNRISVKDLIEKIIKLSGRKLGIKRIDEKRSEEIKGQYVSFNKARRLLRWKAKTALDDGLTQAVAWYSKYFSR